MVIAKHRLCLGPPSWRIIKASRTTWMLRLDRRPFCSWYMASWHVLLRCASFFLCLWPCRSPWHDSGRGWMRRFHQIRLCQPLSRSMHKLTPMLLFADLVLQAVCWAGRSWFCWPRVLASVDAQLCPRDGPKGLLGASPRPRYFCALYWSMFLLCVDWMQSHSPRRMFFRCCAN